MIKTCTVSRQPCAPLACPTHREIFSKNRRVCLTRRHVPQVDAILRLNGVKPIQEVDMMTRQSIACPAFPLCGLAQVIFPSAASLRVTWGWRFLMSEAPL